jgi:2-polyprenyl-6-hydroxyphenyl methylase / 3-demethylubiquinone-9 3-methyltransferase
MSVDNELYERLAESWWDEDEPVFSTLRFFINPVRFGYFASLMESVLRVDKRTASFLDVGCGGGFLAEEFAKIGIAVTGVDPSGATIDMAQKHARTENLTIDYRVGRGENLPFSDASFTMVCCCDALEHVDDPDRVIGEISRVLKPGGAFLYDTVNRTFVSRLVIIKAMQEWKSTSFARDAHDWKKFIKPGELMDMMERHGLTGQGIKGISSDSDPFTAYVNMVRAKKGKITYRELGRRLAFRLSGNTMCSYMGYAIKEYRS